MKTPRTKEPTRRTSNRQTNPADREKQLYLKRIEGLEAENEILKNALDELTNEKKNLLKQIEETEADYDEAMEDIARLENMYVTARALVNIPDTMGGLVFELLKSRFLIFDKIICYSGGLLNREGEPIAENADKFELLTDILPPAESLRKAKATQAE